MLTDEDEDDPNQIPQASQRQGAALDNTYAEFDEDGNPLPNMTREEYDSEDENSPKSAQVTQLQ